MSVPYSTGPACFYVGVGPNNAPLFLGTCEGEPTVTFDPDFEPVMNDIGGQRKPIDYQYMGEEADWSCVFTKYNEGVLKLIQTRVYRLTAARGSQPFGSMGSFMALEGQGFPLWVTFPYATKAAMAANGLPRGMHFPIAYDASDHMPVSTRYRKIQVQFHCQRQLVVTPAGPGFVLWDEVFPTLPPYN